ncbi:SbsB [Geobacillus stearothermophilus]|nr:SbsB [Geobacillus stearothermophilus]
MAYQPKSYRKFAATTATAAMVASAVAPVASLAAGFTDVAPQYKEAVDFLVSTGATNGKTETQFGVYEQITRLDAAVILAKVLKLDVENAKDAGFTDVPKDRAKYVNALVEAGILNGKGDGKFGAYDNLSRVEMAKIVANAYKLEKQNDSALPFTDVNATWAPFVKALYDNGVTSGKTPTSFGAYENITRGDFARFVFKAANVNVAPAVVSVSAINAKELVVKFNKAINKDTVLDTKGNIVANVFFVNGVGVTGTGSLSEDGKTLTITKSTGTWEGTYLFEVKKDTVKTTDGKSVEAFAEKISYEDTVAPTYTGITRVNASKVKVNFSEPIKDKGTITAKLADGTDLSAVVLTSIDGNSIVFDLSNATIPSGKDIAVTISGLMDYSDNLVNPNPVTVTIQKGAKDGVQPDVASITPINAKKFEIKFTEEIEGLDINEITVNGTRLAAPSKVTQDKTDKTKYIVELANPVQGLVTIGVVGGAGTYTDLSGEVGKSASRIVDFKTDTTKPTLSSATVSKNKDGKEVLTLTFSEDVTLIASGTVNFNVKKVKDYVTTTGLTLAVDTTKLTPVSGKSNEFTILLSDLTVGGSALETGAVYTADLPANFVEDTAGNKNDAKTAAFTFTRGTDADATKPTIVTSFDSSESAPQVANNGILVVDKNTLKVKFAGDIDGATATNKANYYVSGATVDSVALLPNNEVEIKLAADSNTYTGLRTVKISGVKTKSGNTMDEYTTTEYLVENVRPTVTGVQLTSIVADDDATKPGDQPATYVTLTFSENVNVGAVNAADFDLYIKGNKVTTATVTTTAGSSPNKVVVKLAGVALTGQDIADGVELKAQSDIDIADGNGNIANIPAPIKVTLQ